MVMARKSLGDYMIDKGYASPTEIEEARKAQSTTKGDLAKILVDLGLNPKHVYESKAQEMGVPFVDLSVFKPEVSAINIVPQHVAKRHNVLPVKKDGNILWVAMADPNNITASDDLRLVSRCSVRGVLASPGTNPQNDSAARGPYSRKSLRYGRLVISMCNCRSMTPGRR